MGGIYRDSQVNDYDNNNQKMDKIECKIDEIWIEI